ncbi:hypothetical protein ACX8XN_17860 [Calditrichota bacterium GD2]
MKQLNYFQILCLFWAALGIGSRVLMAVMGNRWKEWELNSAYREEKPKWLYAVGVLGLALIAYTWYAVFTLQVAYSWIIAALVSVTGIKIYMALFRYSQFREFVVRILNDRRRMRQLNVAVLIFSALCVVMAFFLYN